MPRQTNILQAGIDDRQLAQLVVDLRADDRLRIVQDETEQREPQIIARRGSSRQEHPVPLLDYGKSEKQKQKNL